MYLVTAIRDRYDENNIGVEVVGIFTTKEKAYEAQQIVKDWCIKEGFYDAIVMIAERTPDHLGWYEMDKDL